MTGPQLTALKAEITTDPRGYGYAPFVAQFADAEVARIMNVTRDGSPGTVPTFPAADSGVASGIITVKRSDISAQELLEAIDSRDFPNQPDWRQSWFESATQQSRLRLIDDAGNDTRVLGNLKRIVTNTNGTQSRLTALATRPGSRGEELFGTNVDISAADVEAARKR